MRRVSTSGNRASASKRASHGLPSSNPSGREGRSGVPKSALGVPSVIASIVITRSMPKAPRGLRRVNFQMLAATLGRFGSVHSLGAAMTAAWAGWSSACTSRPLTVPDPGVEPGVGDVHHEVYEDQRHRHNQHDALYYRVVQVADGVDHPEP